MNIGPWHTEDFESLSWHDIHVHGFAMDGFDEDYGTSDFVLDIDYILKWQEVEGKILFTVCRAELRFHYAFRLKIALDYASPTAGMCPFSIDRVHRKLLENDSTNKSFCWHILINWPIGSIEFEARGFTLTLIGEPVVQFEQWLSQDQRSRIGLLK